MVASQAEINKLTRQKPDIRAITRLVPASGNLVQGQSELPIDPRLAAEAARVIAASQNHYSAAEGVPELRGAIARKIRAYNNIEVDAEAKALELLVTPGGTGALVAIAETYLKNHSALVFEPYYPYHRRIIEECGGKTETFTLGGDELQLDEKGLRERCRELKNRAEFPLRAIIVCSPANPTGKVMNREELHAIAAVCQEFDLMCVADEVYEHYVADKDAHVSIAALPGMHERTVTVNSFSKSWNISGWRLGYVYGDGKLVAPLNNANNVFYVCSATPLQYALASVLMADADYYERLRRIFDEKRRFVTGELRNLGFRIYDSGSAFYVWARIPIEYNNAVPFNEMLMKSAGVAGVPGSAFTDSTGWDDWMRFCIAREDDVLHGALDKMSAALS